MNLKEIGWGGIDWIHWANLGWAFVKTVINLQDEEFLVQLMTTEEGVCCIVLVGLFL
jgi:hypothetical protein